MERMRDDFVDEFYEYTRLKSGRPMNETEEHFFCKCVGQIWLFYKCDCRFISTEVEACWHMDENIPGYSPHGAMRPNKSIIDVIGMQRRTYDVYGVEAKASLADYRNGFCACMPYTFVICPDGVIPPDEVPEHIGLIYVDIPNFYLVGYGEMHGVRLVKSPRKRWDRRWFVPSPSGGLVFNEQGYTKQVDKWYDRICYRNTLKNVFNRQNVPIYKARRITRKKGSD